MSERTYPSDEEKEGRYSEGLEGDEVVDSERRFDEGLQETGPTVARRTETVETEPAGVEKERTDTIVEEAGAAVPPDRVAHEDDASTLEKEAEGRFDKGQADEKLTFEKEVEGRFDEGQQEVDAYPEDDPK